MLVEAYRTPDNSFHWIDLSDPTGEELEYITKTYHLHTSAVRDCLVPKHLPKLETVEDTVFVILRAYDERSRNSGTIRGLTRKIAIFIGKNYLITIHRNDLPYITQIRKAWVKNQKNLKENPMPKILIRIIQGVFSSYGEALYRYELALEDFENKIFKQGATQFSIRQKFLVKRKVSVIKRMLKMTLAIMPKFKKICRSDLNVFREMHEFGGAQYFTSEEVLENVNNLINLQLSLASHQTSEVVRVLTMFSVFFLPMSFIVGIYGMNFKNMPELESQYGYPIVLVVTFSVAISLFWYFKRKKWIRLGD